MINIWGINHDPIRHPDPESFVPERYEGDNTSAMQSLNSADPTKRDHFAFGAGRRVCPGYNVAERSVAVAVMRLLWAFEIGVREGASMDPTSWKGDFSGNAGRDMPAVLTPRGRQRVEIINREFREAQAERGPVVSCPVETVMRMSRCADCGLRNRWICQRNEREVLINDGTPSQREQRDARR